MVRILTDEELREEIELGKRRGQLANETEPRATSARYNRTTGMVELNLRDGCFFAFPAHNAQGLRGAPPELLEQVEVLGGGYALRWEQLDADFTVPGLLEGFLGTRRWMAEHLGRSGGKSTSEAKTRAARANGMKGGRPPRKAAAKKKG